MVGKLEANTSEEEQYLTDHMLLKSSHKRVQEYDDEMTPSTQPASKRARVYEDDHDDHHIDHHHDHQYDDHQDNYHDVHHEDDHHEGPQAGPQASTSHPFVSSSSIPLTEVSIYD